MKIALDPYMFRALPIDDMRAQVAELGYEYIELSPRRTSCRSSCIRGRTTGASPS